MIPSPASMEACYERRAAEYDDWYLGRGRFADRDRPGSRTEVEDVAATLSSLPPVRTLDVGCGTGFKRYFGPDDLAAEIGPGRLLFRGRWFVLMGSTRRSA